MENKGSRLTGPPASLRNALPYIEGFTPRSATTEATLITTKDSQATNKDSQVTTKDSQVIIKNSLDTNMDSQIITKNSLDTAKEALLAILKDSIEDITDSVANAKDSLSSAKDLLANTKDSLDFGKDSQASRKGSKAPQVPHWSWSEGGLAPKNRLLITKQNKLGELFNSGEDPLGAGNSVQVHASIGSLEIGWWKDPVWKNK